MPQATSGDSWRIPSFGLGCAPIGDLYRSVGDRDGIGTVVRSLERGVRMFDTAPRYGLGLSETRLGAALQAADRQELTICTKVGWLVSPEGSRVADFTRAGVLRSLESSLTRLGLDRVDIAHVHDPDDHMDQAMAEAIPTLLELRDQGVIRALGVGMNRSGLLSRFVTESVVDYVLIAGRYTLLEQPALQDLMPACVGNGVGVIAAGVYNSGLLANPSAQAPYNYAPTTSEALARALRLQEICHSFDVPLKAAAVQFPVTHPAVVSVVVGAASPEEAEENVGLSSFPIPDDLWRALSAEGLIDREVPTP
jgi:D-threo-aldose 1-dehydrogenase